MRRLQYDAPSQAVKNLITNPELVADVSDKLLFKNVVTNPSFETASGTTTVRTNLATNPSFETASGTVTARTNLATNPSFESTGAATTVRTNLVTHPSFELSSGTATVRTNLSPNPGMEAAGSAVVVRTNRALNPGFEADSGTVTVRANSVNNPSLAVNATGWTTYGGSSTHPNLVTSRAAASWSTSGYAWKVEGTASSLPHMAEVGMGDYVLSSGPVSVSVNVIANATRRARIRIRWAGSGGDHWSPDFWLNADAPTRMTYTTTAPAGATGFSFNVKEGSGTPDNFLAGDWIAASMAMVELNTLVPGPYFDGSTPNTNLISNSNFEVNGNGWWPNTGSPTLTTSSDQAFLGTKSLKAVTTTAQTDCAVTCTIPGLKAGQTYTLSYYVYSMDARTNAYFDVAATNYNAAGVGSRSIPAQTWTRVTGTFTISPTMTGDTAFYLHHAGGPATTGTIVYIDAVLLEKTDLVNPYFDGQGDMTYSWAATAHASTSYERAPGVANILTTLSGNGGATSKVYQTAISRNGKGLKLTKRGGYAYFDTNLTGLTSGASYTFSYDVLTDQTKVDTVDRGTAAAPIYGPSQRTVTPNVWNRVTRTIVVGAGETTRNLSIAGWEHATVSDGAWMIVDNFLIEETTATLPYFDGATAAAEGLTYAWTGTANASTSEQRGVAVAENIQVPGNTITWQSTTRYRSGSKSLAAQLKVALADHATIRYPATEYTVGVGAGQLAPSTVYTWSLYVWVPTGGGSVKLYDVTTNTTGTASTLTNQWERISLTFTTPASGTLFLRLRSNGNMSSGTTIWVDEELIESSNSLKPYFDGANPVQNLCVNPSFATGITNYTSISASLTRITTMGDGHVGELTQTIANAARQGAIYLSPTILPSDTYTVSFDMAGTAAEFTNVRSFLYDSVTATIVSAAPTITLIKDGNLNRYTFNLTASASFDRIYLETMGTNIPIGAKSWVDRVLVERGTTASSPYYEGTGDLTHAWTGTANASTSTQTAPNATGWGNLGSLYRSTIDPKIGTYSAALQTRGLNGDGLWPGTNLDVIAGRTYTFSAWIKATTSHALTMAFRWSDASNVSTGADTNVTVTSQLVVGKWALVSATATAPANTAKLQMMTRIYETHTPTTFYMDGAICAESFTPIPYFDGATAASGDYTYMWNGTANASTSLMRGTTVSENAVLNSVPVSSTDWKGLGTKSIRLVPTLTHLNDSFTAVGGDTGALRLGMQAGKTYTISATIRLAAPQTGTLSSRARKIVVFHKSPADQFHAEAPSAQAANVAGETRLSVTVTIPATANEAFVRLYNGAYGGHGDVWWDNLLVEETTNLKPYFDGSTPALENLAKTAPAAYNGLTATTGVNFAGSVWTRGSTPSGTINGPMFRLLAALSDLRQGERYTISVTVANDQSTSQAIQLDWADTTHTPFTIQPGEIRRISIYGTRTNYDNVYRFVDLDVTGSATESRSILVKDWMIELGQTSGEYYSGTGDFTYGWSGTANASTSGQTATGLATYGTAWNAVCYRTGTAGNYRGRVSFTTGIITDSGLAFAGAATFAPSKTYTVSVDVTSDTTRSIRFSSQGSGTVLSTSAPIALTAGVKARHSFTFTTTETAPASVSLYVLRSDLLPGNIDFDNMLIEEAPHFSAYFDGSTPAHVNLLTNPSFSTNTTGWGANIADYVLTRDTTTGRSNTYSGKVTVNVSNGGDINTFTSMTPVKPGEVFTASAYVKTSSSATIRATLDFRNAGSNTLTASSTDTAVGTDWTRVSVTATAPASAEKVFVRFGSSAALPVGFVYWVDDVLLEKSSTLSEYFEGTGDFSYAWTGTAHASTSTMTAPNPASISGNAAGRVAWQSNSGPVPGKKSVAVLSQYPNVDTFVELPNPFSGEILGGRTFTLIVTRKTTETFPASGNDGRAWRPIWQAQKSGGGYALIQPPIGPTTAGIHTMKYTFTFDADVTTSYFFRLYNGSSSPRNVVWWDNLALIEGAYPGEYFDGDTLDTSTNTYLWDGTAGASKSSMRGFNLKGTWFEQRAITHVSADQPFSGSHKVKASVSQIGYFPRLVSNTFAAVPGRRYTAFAKMKCSTQPVQIGLKWIASPDIYPSEPSQSASNGNWVKVSTTGICPPEATHVQLFIGVPDSSPLNTEFEIDSVLLTDRGYEGPFGSGDSYGWTWEGTPHASASKGYPVGLMQLAGKPLFIGALPGQYVLTDIDPAKNPVIPAGAPRTIYSIVNNLMPLASGALDSVYVYGVDSLNDTTPNTTIIARQQSQSGNLTNALNARRTGGGGPITLNVPASGRQILIAGINENGNMFSAVNKSALVVDTPTVIMSVPHERIRIEPDSIYHQHVVTYIYPGVHSSAVRAEMVKLLADHYNIPGLG